MTLTESKPTPRAVVCTNRDQNFGRVCIPSMPNDPQLWCIQCIDRRAPGPSIGLPLTEARLRSIRLNYEKYSRIGAPEARELLAEVLRLRE